ncbi:MAG: hypothetical protein ACOC4B_03275 [Bacteroidota bacterium]
MIIVTKTIEYPFVFVQCIGLFNFENVSSFEDIPDFFYDPNTIFGLFQCVKQETKYSGTEVILDYKNSGMTFTSGREF